MPDYGLRVKDALGNVVLTITDKITRFRYSNVVSSGVSGNTTLSDISGLSTVEFGIGLDTTVGTDVPHLVSRSGTTISWAYNDGINYNSADTIVFVFLYT